MRRKKIIFLLVAGVLLVLAGAKETKSRAVSTDSLKKTGQTVIVEGSVYDAGGQMLTDRFATVEAGTKVGEDGGADGEIYTSAIDENGRYHLELPVGYYHIYYHFHNRALGTQYTVSRNCVIDLRLYLNFYQTSGRVYLNGQPYRNGKLRLLRQNDDPNTPWDDNDTELETDENGDYDFSFIKGIDGNFLAQYQIKGAMYETKDLVNLPGTTVSGHDIYITGELSQDPLPTLSPTTEPSALPAPTQTTEEPKQSPQDSTSKSNDAKNTTTNKNTLKKGMTFTQKGLRYKITSYTTRKKEVMLLGSTKKNVKKIVIPAAVTTKKVSFPVTAIASKAFYHKKKLAYVMIGSNIERIGVKAFYKDNVLKKVVFKTGKLKKVGTKAFVGINNNARIIIPTSCKKKYIRLLEGKY